MASGNDDERNPTTSEYLSFGEHSPNRGEDITNSQNSVAQENFEIDVNPLARSVTANGGLHLAPPTQTLIHPPVPPTEATDHNSTQLNIPVVHHPPARRSEVTLCGCLTLSLKFLKIMVVVMLSLCLVIQIVSSALQWIYATESTFHRQIIMGGVNVVAAVCMIPLICIPPYLRHLFGITMMWIDVGRVVAYAVVAIVKMGVYVNMVKKAKRGIRAPYGDLH